MNFIKKSPILYYLFFLTLTIILYFNTYKAGFVTDFLGWQSNFDNYPFLSVIDGEAYNIKSFYHFTHLLMYAMTSAFRLWGLPWFLLFSALFAFNAFLVFKIFLRIFKGLHLNNHFSIAFIGVLMFMLSPYHSEVMVWRASFHYLTAFSMMLLIIDVSLRYVDKPHNRYGLIAVMIFACSIFSLEFFLFTPFVVLVFILFQWLNFPRSFNIQATLGRFVGVPLLMIAGYFILYKSTHGKWIAHYGSQNHTQLLSPEAFATYGKYVAKYLGFIRYFKHTTKESFYAYFNTPSVSWAIVGLVIIFSILGLVFFKKLTVRNRLIFLNFGLFSLLLVPIMTLFFSYVLLTENDRYGYMASAFLFMGISLILSYLPKPLYYAFSVVFICISTFLTIKNTRLWAKSEKVMTTLIKNYRWWDTDKPVFILNAPDSFEGMPMFRTFGDESAVAEALELYQQRKLKAPMVEVAGYNMTALDNGAHVRVDSLNQVFVTFNQWGTWWWHKGNGASDYETPDYHIQFDYKGCGNCYKLTFKNNNDRILLFQTSDTLKEVDRTKWNVEQW